MTMKGFMLDTSFFLPNRAIPKSSPKPIKRQCRRRYRPPIAPSMFYDPTLL